MIYGILIVILLIIIILINKIAVKKEETKYENLNISKLLLEDNFNFSTDNVIEGIYKKSNKVGIYFIKSNSKLDVFAFLDTKKDFNSSKNIRDIQNDYENHQLLVDKKNGISIPIDSEISKEDLYSKFDLLIQIEENSLHYFL